MNNRENLISNTNNDSLLCEDVFNNQNQVIINEYQSKYTMHFKELFQNSKRIYKIDNQMFSLLSQKSDIRLKKIIISDQSIETKRVWQKLRSSIRFISMMHRFLYKKKLLGISTSIKNLNITNLNPVKRTRAFYWFGGLLGSDITNPVTKWFIVYEKNVLYKFWLFVNFIVGILAIFILPYIYSFYPLLGYYEFDISFDLICIILIISKFFVSFSRRDKIIDNLKDIYRNYVNDWLLFDLIFMIPWDIILYSITQSITFYRLLKIFKLLRVVSILNRFFGSNFIFSVFERLSFDQTYNYFIVFFFSILLFANIMSCIFWLISIKNNYYAWFNKMNYFINENKSRFLSGLYWTITTIMTVGFGDIVPVSKVERIFSVFVIISGVAFYSYTISTLTTILSEKSQIEMTMMTRVGFLDDYHLIHNLSESLLERIAIALDL